MISYVRRGRYILAGGGLFAPDDHCETLLGEFVEAASRARLHLAFYNICDEALSIFRKFGFQVTKWGEEPIVDLGNCTWSGKSFEWVRRQTNYCLRNGLAAFEVHPEGLESAQWSRTLAELREVSAQSLGHKPQAVPIRFFEGQIEDHDLGLRRLFIARNTYGAGRVEGFVVCNPMRNGRAWATELYRRRTDSVRGTMAFLFHHILQKLQEEGIRHVGLCLDPGQRCANPLPGDSALVRRSMQFGDRHLGLIFDVAGLRHFKTRFRPRFENRYICANPKATLGSTLAFAHASGLFRLSPLKLARVCIDRARKRVARQSLACEN
jgi:phosphatidylglycerol lysyltransferase